jgi:predicted transglutaminase-like cysteine proteinase
MRHLLKLTATGLLTAAFWSSQLQAADLRTSYVGFPPTARQVEQIRMDLPALAPMAHVRFCLQYHDDCEIRGGDFGRRNVALTPDRWNELNAVNRAVNQAIIPEPNLGGVATEEWLVSPPAGDCNDYAVTKRHVLLTHGWPSRSLLLSEVVVPSGEHHLVLVVRTTNVDLVLDNLNANIRSVGMTYNQYRWIRIESSRNPKFWATVRLPGPMHWVDRLVYNAN